MLSRRAGSALRVHDYMQRHPFFKIPDVAKALSISKPTVSTAIEGLIELGLVAQLTARERGRTFFYRGYVSILTEDT